MDDYLTKPISVEQLRAVIARWREHRPVAATQHVLGGG
jgi:DNA-binding response OmpR family regulator